MLDLPFYLCRLFLARLEARRDLKGCSPEHVSLATALGHFSHNTYHVGCVIDEQ